MLYAIFLPCVLTCFVLLSLIARIQQIKSVIVRDVFEDKSVKVNSVFFYDLYKYFFIDYLM